MGSGFALSDCPIVTIPIGGGDKSFRDLAALTREPKLLPHFGETGTAVLSIQEIDYCGHDLNPVV
jgi:hypothetical protein